MSASAAAELPFARREASHGARWLRDAFAMLWAHRVRWLLLLLVYYFIIVSINLIPLLGAYVAPLLKPVFAVGFLAAAWSQERGQPPTVGHLFRGFRSNLAALLPLGVVFLVGMIAAVFATSWIDGGKVLEVLSGGARPDEAVLARGDVQAAMLFGALCALPVLLALWFAPALVVFQDCGASRALLTSLRASVANWRPLVVYGLLLFFYGIVLPAAIAMLVAATAPQDAAYGILMLVLLPYLAFFIATLNISDYVSYRDIFHPDERSASHETGTSASA